MVGKDNIIPSDVKVDLGFQKLRHLREHFLHHPFHHSFHDGKDRINRMLSQRSSWWMIWSGEDHNISQQRNTRKQ